MAPILLGTAFAASDDAARALPALLACATALLLQLGANLANDVFDFERGADGADRLGPPRAVQSGLVSARAMRRATAAVFALAALCGLGLVAEGGWPVALAGALSLAAGLAYTGGPFPLAYHGLGDLAVLVFFGPVAVGGSHFVQAGTLPAAVLVASLVPGLLAAAILVVNNLRDIASDARAGKRTLAVRLGAASTRRGYALLLALAAAVPVAAVALGLLATPALLPLVLAPWAVRLARRVAREEGPALNDVLAATARLQAVATVLLAAGVLA